MSIYFWSWFGIPCQISLRLVDNNEHSLHGEILKLSPNTSNNTFSLVQINKSSGCANKILDNGRLSSQFRNTCGWVKTYDTLYYWLLYQFNRYFDVRCTRVLIRPKNPCTMDDPWSLSTLGATLWPSRRHCPWYQVVGQGRLQLPLPLLRHGGLPADSKFKDDLSARESWGARGCQSVSVCIHSFHSFKTVKALTSACPVLRRWTPNPFLLGWMTFWSRWCHFVVWERRTGCHRNSDKKLFGW